jgi:hypothetical protein
MRRKKTVKPDSTRFLDYPASLSEYERESLAAEATLKAERTKTPKRRKDATTQPTSFSVPRSKL